MNTLFLVHHGEEKTTLLAASFHVPAKLTKLADQFDLVPAKYVWPSVGLDSF